MNRSAAEGLIVLSLLLAGPATAQTSYPMIMSLKPVAAQVGTTSEHTISSRYSMYGAYQVLVTGQGVTGEVVPPEVKPKKDGTLPSVTSLKVRFAVAPDAQPGVRDFRLATPQGASTLGQLVVVRDPVVTESGNNNTQDQAQPVPVPATVCGAIERAEDVDFFKFEVAAPTELVFHVRAMRLEDKIHDLQQHCDPLLTLRSATGQTLAVSDNFFSGDPCLSYRFTAAGTYLLEIRDVRFQGNRYWEYCIEISDRPLVTTVFPLAVMPGQPVELELVGLNLPPKATGTVELPPNVPPGVHATALSLAGQETNPVPVVVTDVPPVAEQAGKNDSVEGAQPIEIPAAINGRIEREMDVDCYRFAAKKGERFSFEIVARRVQSSLDSHMRILDANGRQLALNDDLRLGLRTYADSWIENWAAPADGRYVIEIRDLHLRGGADFVYLLKVTRSRPYFELYVDTDKTQLTPSTGGVIFVRAVRKNGFAGAIQLAIDGLPPGVTAQCGRILPGKGQDGCIVLAAASDTPLSAANVTITGRAIGDDAAGVPEAVARPQQEIYQPGGGRGHWPVQLHTVAVGAPSDLRAVVVKPTEVQLKPGQSQRIDVHIERAEGFNKNVTLDVAVRHLSRTYGSSLPEGVSIDGGNSKTLLTGGATDGYITLKAAPNAPPVEDQLVPVMANVAINFVMKATYAGQPLRLTVLPK